MFIVLLTIGIGNILMSLASMVDRRSPMTASTLHVSWIVLLLLVYFSLFWHTLDILSFEEWQFGEFLYVMLGPVLILFASQILLPDPSLATGDVDENYMSVSRPFFLFLAASQLWVNGVDLILRDGLTRAGALNGVAVIIALVLAFSSSRTVHVLMTIAMWVLFVVGWIIKGFGLLD
jgi:uncharacterized membrane protein YGL010W